MHVCEHNFCATALTCVIVTHGKKVESLYENDNLPIAVALSHIIQLW